MSVLKQTTVTEHADAIPTGTRIELEIGFVNPLARCVDAELRIAVRYLFDGYDDFHSLRILVVTRRRGLNGYFDPQFRDVA